MDKTAFITALDRADNMLFRVAWAMLYNEEDCRDAMQETALKAWQHRAGLRDERYFSTWITRILINEWKLICQGVFYLLRPISGLSKISANIQAASSCGVGEKRPVVYSRRSRGFSARCPGCRDTSYE